MSRRVNPKAHGRRCTHELVQHAINADCHCILGEVWNAHDPDAVDRFVEDDIIVEIGGRKVFGKDNFKDWIRDFLEGVNELHVDAIETFQNEDATRVTSRWYLTGTNNGIFGGKADQHPVAMTGISIWQVDEDGKLARGWIEQASHELYQRLIVK